LQSIGIASKLGYTLIVAEKRECAERIAKALDDNGIPSRYEANGIPYFSASNNGKRLIIVPSVGHLYTMAPQQESVASYPVFAVAWTAAYLFNKRLKHTKKWIETFSKLSEGASDFISATDYDIEGELIGYTILKYACGDKEQKAKRMLFSTLTKKELQESYNNLSKELNFRLIESGETRHMVDFLWGINLSRALTSAVKKTAKRYISLSAGRVQGPTLKFLVNREKEIQGFIPLRFWRIYAEVKIGNLPYPAEYFVSRIDSESEAEQIVGKSLKQDGFVEDVNVSTYEHRPPIPFDLGLLQAESYRLFGYTPSQSLRAAEKLYLKALISYPRTSSQKIPLNIDCRKIISSLSTSSTYRKFVEKLLLKSELIPTQGKNEDQAHPSIYPTGNLPKNHLDSVTLNVFDLIVKRFLSVFGSPAIREKTRISIAVNDETFHLDGFRTLDQGWYSFYTPYVITEEVQLPPLSIGQKVLFSNVCYKQLQTPPPPRYTASSLLKLLEKQKIGTKSTRSEIIDILYKRAYITEKKIVVSELGLKIYEVLQKYCQEVVSVKFTRILEERMEKIEKGLDEKRAVLGYNVKKLETILLKFKQNEEIIGNSIVGAIKKGTLEKQVIGACPVCAKGKLVVVRSRTTGKRFAGCSNFSEGLCNAAFPLPQFQYKIKLKRKICKICSWPMITVSSGKRFWDLCLNPACPKKKNRIKI